MPRKPSEGSKRPSTEARVQLLVRVPQELHRALKHVAVDRDTSVNDVVTQALQEWWRAQPERRRY